MLNDILEITPNGSKIELTDFFRSELDRQISSGIYPEKSGLEFIRDGIVSNLHNYKSEHNISTVVIGMSGGGVVPVYMSADKKAYMEKIDLGDETNKRINIIVDANSKLSFDVVWNESISSWDLFWGKTTIVKPVSDELAYKNVSYIADKVERYCQ